MFLKNIPTTIEDFEKKEKGWLGFEKALKIKGLDVDTVRKRLKKGKLQ